MRGTPGRQLSMLSSLSTEDLIPAEHPIRRIRVVVDEVPGELDGEFEPMYSTKGRPSVPPEVLLKATVLMAMYSMRSERAFCERLNYDMLFKWFLDLPIDAPSFNASTFSKNRQRTTHDAKLSKGSINFATLLILAGPAGSMTPFDCRRHQHQTSSDRDASAFAPIWQR